MSDTSFLVKMAGRLIRVEPMTSSLKLFCEDYLAEDGGKPGYEADFTAAISEEDLAYERKLSRRVASLSEEDLTEAFLEKAALHRKITEGLLPFDTILIHASCLAIDGAGICFAAPSGVGKSTHAAFWREQFKERVQMVNDDKPFLQITEKGAVAYGSPWNGVHRLGGNISVPLAAFCLLRRDVKTHIEALTPQEAYPFLMSQAQRPKNAADMQKFLPLIDRLAHQVKLYSLSCSLDPDSAEIVYDKIFSAEPKEVQSL